MDAATDEWGIRVERVEVWKMEKGDENGLENGIFFWLEAISINSLFTSMQKQVKDVRLPQSLQRAMAAEAEAAREARAKVMMLVVMMVMVVTMVVMIMIFFFFLMVFFSFPFHD